MPFDWSALPASPSADTASADAPLAITPLPSLASLQVSGQDCYKFLQGQCTTDFREVEQGKVLPGAICSLKGRALFTFLAIPSGEAVYLLLPQDQLADAHAHLKKYSIFSKVTLMADSATPLLGVQGSGSNAVLSNLLQTVPVAGQSASNDGILAAALTNDRYLLALPAEQAEAVAAKLLSMQALVTTENAWHLADIRAGLAHVQATTRDQFQPQELNYPALSGVSYNKGCYTGQEVVARLYFRGKLKQRLYRLSAEGEASGETGIYAGEQHVGDVVNIARSGDNGIELLAIVKNAAINNGALTLGLQGPALHVQDLPYALHADKEE